MPSLLLHRLTSQAAACRGQRCVKDGDLTKPCSWQRSFISSYSYSIFFVIFTWSVSSLWPRRRGFSRARRRRRLSWRLALGRGFWRGCSLLQLFPCSLPVPRVPVLEGGALAVLVALRLPRHQAYSVLACSAMSLATARVSASPRILGLLQAHICSHFGSQSLFDYW